MRGSAEWAAAVLSVTYEPLVTADRQGIVTGWSPAMSELTGVSAEKALGGSLVDLLRPRAASSSLRALLRTVAGNEVWRGEVDLPHVYGDRIPCACRISGARDERGRMRGFVVAFRELGSEARSESDFDAASELLITLDRISDGFMVLDRDWTVIYMNPAGREILQLSDPLGRSLADLFPYPESQEFFTRYAAALRAREAQHFEAFYATSGRWYDVHAYPSREGIVVYFRDITERRSREQLLRQSNERFTLAARATRDMVFDWDVASNTVWRSDALETLLGYQSASLGSNPDDWLSVIHPEDRESFREARRRFVEDGGDLMLEEFRVRRRDGSFASVMSRAYAVRDASGRAIRVIGAVTDVSRQKEAERNLAESQKRLMALSRRLLSAQEAERKRVARDLHDQLGQSLTALKYAVRKTSEGQTSRSAEELGRMIDEAIDDVRRIARKLRPPLLDQLGLVTALEREVSEFSVSTGVTASVSSEPESLILDPDLSITCFRIAQEALTNVARHAGASEVRIHLEQSATRTVMRIHDNGQGISVDEAYGRTSLGIIGMKERARLLGGDVEIAHGAEGGTVVTLTMRNGFAGGNA